MITTIRTPDSLPLLVLHVGTLPVISAEQLHGEPVEHLVTTDGNLQAAVRATNLRLYVEEPGSTVTAHQENIVEPQDQTAIVRALRHRMSMRHGPNLHEHGGQGPLARPEHFQDAITLRRAPSPDQDFTTALSLKTAWGERT